VCAEAELLFDPALNELLLVNCTTYSGGPTTLTVWGWNGSAWHVVTSGPAPARVVGGAALDTDAEMLVVYGGFVPGVDPCNEETWQWNGAPDEWSQVAADPTPSACDHLKMIYDPGAQTSILVGGQDASGAAVNETWAFDGKWQQLDAQLPPSRAHFGLQYDSANKRHLLYGGLTQSAVLGDFWQWADLKWTQLDDPDAASRSHVGMVYDSRDDTLYVFGGATATDTFGSLTDDMWQFKDGQWRDLQPDTTPGERGSAGMGYDPERDQIVLYGGFDATGAELADTWLWDGSDWTCAVNCALT
jgi:hypothetical protein